MSQWQAVLELDHNRTMAGRSEATLCDAIRNGADLRVNTEFRHNQHIDVTSDCPEIIQQSAEFRVTCLLDDRWVGRLYDFASADLLAGWILPSRLHVVFPVQSERPTGYCPASA